jgi:hypothetical protein
VASKYPILRADIAFWLRAVSIEELLAEVEDVIEDECRKRHEPKITPSYQALLNRLHTLAKPLTKA